ncbi:MAG: hypothetical protein QW511_01155 [Candidatus Methanomethylicia archaeon]
MFTKEATSLILNILHSSISTKYLKINIEKVRASRYISKNTLTAIK